MATEPSAMPPRKPERGSSAHPAAIQSTREAVSASISRANGGRWIQRVSTLLAVTLSCPLAHSATAQQITGSGSTFVYPVMRNWADVYEQKSGIHVDYQPLGSSRGIADIEAG